jgi:hypothetical protein
MPPCNSNVKNDFLKNKFTPPNIILNINTLQDDHFYYRFCRCEKATFFRRMLWQVVGFE